MKPVLILQHLAGDGPAYLASWLQRRGVPVDLRCTEAGQPFPDHLRAHGALAILGGEMSANDELPSLRRTEALVREAIANGQPVIGHCLGGQLMARAMGSRVVDSPAPEVGWQPIEIESGPVARQWFGSLEHATVFQWHYEAFELPPQAQGLARSGACPHQAFAIGPHLALQFHLEVDAEKIGRWSLDEGARWLEARQRHPASVQAGAALREGLATHLVAHQALADRLYARWLEGVAAA